MKSLIAFIGGFLVSISATAQLCIPGPSWPREIVKAGYAASANAFGEGIKIAVVDTGIDRDHPSFREVKITGKDFVGDNQLAAYPYFDNEGHGTHVAGIIAGRDCAGVPFGLAPKSELFIARACGEQGCRSDQVAQAIEWAVAQKVDVINISIEGDSLQTAKSEIEAVRHAIAAGISVVTISGNGGNRGSNNIIGEVEGVIVTGAFNKWGGKPFFSQTASQTLAAPGVNILSAVPRGQGYQIVANAEAFKPDLVTLLNTPLPKNLKSSVFYSNYGEPESLVGVSGKILVTEQGGGIGIEDKVFGAQRAGALAVLVLMENPYFAVGLQTLEKFRIPVLFGTKEESSQFKNLSANKGHLEITSISGDYVLESGTSMAAPFVTGAVALVKAQNRRLSPFQILDILTRAADRADLNRSPLGDPEFGAGMLNIEKALKLSTGSQQ